MNIVSFMTANYVARQLNYNMTEGWMQGDEATNAYFRPLESYAARFEAILQDIAGLGFTAIDLWMAHLHYNWATPEHIVIARDLLAKYRLPVVSLAGGFGTSREEFERACQLAVAMDAPVLGGNTALLESDRTYVAETLRRYNVKFGYENHPEKSVDDMIAKVGHGDEDVIGVCVDTGWFGTHRFDAVAALNALAPRLFHVHLKDVLAPGAHETCRYGLGCVPIEACVHTLKELGYTGAISIEHEPTRYNPNEDCKANLSMVNHWLEH